MRLPGRGQSDDDKERPDARRSSRDAERKNKDSDDSGFRRRSPLGGGSDRSGARDDDDFDFVKDRYNTQRRGSTTPPDDKSKGEGSRIGGLMRRGGDDDDRKPDASESRGRLGSRLGDLSGRRDDPKSDDSPARATGRFGTAPLRGDPTKPGDTSHGSSGRGSRPRGGDADKGKDEDKSGGLLGRFGSRGKKEEDEKKDASGRSRPFLRGADDEQKDTGTRAPGGQSSSFGSRDRSQPIGASDQPRPAARPGGFPRDREDQPGGARPGGFTSRDREDQPGGQRPGGYSRDREDQPGGARPGGFSRDREDAPGGVRPGGYSRDREDQPGGLRPGGVGRDREDQPGGQRSGTPRDQFGATPRTGTFGDRSQPGAARDQQEGASSNRPFSGPPRDQAGSGTGSSLRDRGTTTGSRDTSERDRPGFSPRSASQSQSFSPERRSPYDTSTDKDRGKKDSKDQEKSGGLLGRFGSRGKKEEEKKGDSSRSALGGSRGATRATGTTSPVSPTDSSRRSPFGSTTSPTTTTGSTRRTEPETRRSPGLGREPEKPAAGRGAKKAEKTPPAPKSRAAKPTPLPDAKVKGTFSTRQGLDFDRKIDMIGVALVGFALVTFFAVIPSMSFGVLTEPQGGLTGSLNDLLSQIFGWGKIVWPVVTFGIGLYLMLHSFEGTHVELNYFRLIGLLSLYACALTWIQMLELVKDSAPTVEAFKPISYHLALDQGRGGGWMGHELYIFLLSQLMDWGTLSVLIAWLIMSLMLTFDLSVVEMWGYIAGVFVFLRPNPEARARRKAAQEARTAEIVAAMRPGEEPRQIPLGTAAVAAVGAAAVVKTQEVSAVTPERKGFGLRRGGTETPAVTPAETPAITPANPSPTPPSSPDQPAVRPAINRRGAEAGTVEVPAAAKPDQETAERADPESRVPERRRMPHLRQTQEIAGDTAAGEAPSAAESTPNTADDKSGRGRLGFLRRGRGETEAGSADEASTKPDESTATPAESPRRADHEAASGIPGIPVPPRRRDLVASEASVAPAADTTASAPTSEDQSSGRLRRFMPGQRRSESDSEFAPDKADEKPARTGAPDAASAGADRESPLGDLGTVAAAGAVGASDWLNRRREAGDESPRSFDRPRPAGETPDAAHSESARPAGDSPSAITPEESRPDSFDRPDRSRPLDRPGRTSPLSGTPDTVRSESARSEDEPPLTAAPEGSRPRPFDRPGRVSPLRETPDTARGASARPEDEPPLAPTPEGPRPRPFDRPGRASPLSGTPDTSHSESDQLEAEPPLAPTPEGSRPRPFDRRERPDRASPLRETPDAAHSESTRPVDESPLAATPEGARPRPLDHADQPDRARPFDRPGRPDRLSPVGGTPDAIRSESTRPAEEFPLAPAPEGSRPRPFDRPRPAGETPDADRSVPTRPTAEPPQAVGTPPADHAPAAAEPPAQPSRLGFLRRSEPRPAAPDNAIPPEDATKPAPDEDTAKVDQAAPVINEPPARPRGIASRLPFSRPGGGPASTDQPSEPAAEPVKAEQPTVEAPVETPAPQANQEVDKAAGATAPEVKPLERRFLPQAGAAVPRATVSRAEDKPVTPPPAPPQRPAPPPAETPRQPASVKPPFREPTAAVARGPNAPESRLNAIPAGKYVPPDFTTLLRKGDERHINDEILLDKARVIEDTLLSFGAPGKVVEVNPGPVITQFGIEPSYMEGRGGKRTRVKVGSIARLDADLALALAAKSIRIEAPVPGKGFVGIEVPNDEVSLVGLRDIMDSPEFRRIDSKLRIALGLAVDGSPVAADLTAMPHLLIAGTTGSGKSVCVNSIITCLLAENSPEDVQLIMVDPKRVELTGYNGIPHLVAPVVVDLERIVGVLQWVQREMEERYRKFAAVSARNILDYNIKTAGQVTKMPYYVVVVDELADLMMLAPDETERLLARLAQMARATGIHLIISTQRPSVDIITGLIKANFPARIAFAVASSVDSRVILDQPGAEKLLGRGDMLYQSPDAAAPLRMQGVFVSDEEIMAITRYWRGTLLDQPVEVERVVTPPGRRTDITFNREPPKVEEEDPTRRSPGPSAQPTLWEADANGDDDDLTGEDELYEQAVELVQRLGKASISLLQRRLRIGYTRAARLIDRMELDGLVGPSTEGSKPREVLKLKDEEIGDD